MNEEGHHYEIQTKDSVPFIDSFQPDSKLWNGERELCLGYYYGEELRKRYPCNKYARSICFTDEINSDDNLKSHWINANDFARFETAIEPHLMELTPIKITAYLDVQSEVQFKVESSKS